MAKRHEPDQREGKQFWLWVGGQESYLAEDGRDGPWLDPNADPSEEEADERWWTCHKETRAGDLVLLYRMLPKSDIGYLLEAKSDARIWREGPAGTITQEEYDKRLNEFWDEHQDDEFTLQVDAIEGMRHRLGLSKRAFGLLLNEPESAIEVRYRRAWRAWHDLQQNIERAMGVDGKAIRDDWEGSWVCNFVPRFKCVRPLTREDAKGDPYLAKEWSALRGNFQRRVYAIPDPVWGHLTKQIAKANPGFEPVLNRLMGALVSRDILSEKELEDELAQNLSVLQPEYDLALVEGGRQFPCRGNGGAMGFIDLLCRDRRTDEWVVVELKVVRGEIGAYGQLRSYVGWVREHLAREKPVRGVLISRGVDEKFRWAASGSSDITVLDLDAVRSRLKAQPV